MEPFTELNKRSAMMFRKPRLFPQDMWDSTPNERKFALSHASRINETSAGEKPPSSCERCQEAGRICRVYTEEARKNYHNHGYGFGCSECVRHRDGCSFSRDAKEKTAAEMGAPMSNAPSTNFGQDYEPGQPGKRRSESIETAGDRNEKRQKLVETEPFNYPADLHEHAIVVTSQRPLDNTSSATTLRPTRRGGSSLASRGDEFGLRAPPKWAAPPASRGQRARATARRGTLADLGRPSTHGASSSSAQTSPNGQDFPISTLKLTDARSTPLQAPPSGEAPKNKPTYSQHSNTRFRLPPPIPNDETVSGIPPVAHSPQRSSEGTQELDVIWQAQWDRQRDEQTQISELVVDLKNKNKKAIEDAKRAQEELQEARAADKTAHQTKIMGLEKQLTDNEEERQRLSLLVTELTEKCSRLEAAATSADAETERIAQAVLVKMQGKFGPLAPQESPPERPRPGADTTSTGESQTLAAGDPMSEVQPKHEVKVEDSLRYDPVFSNDVVLLGYDGGA